jgi:centromeric protein E
MNGEELMQGDLPSPRSSGMNAQEEKIFVSIRVRPLNEKEITRNEVSDWECINNTTILFKHSMPDRAMFPSAYSYGKHMLLCSFCVVFFSCMKMLKL